MTGVLPLARRTVLKGAACAGIASGAALARADAFAPGSVRFIVDARLPEAAALAARAARSRHDVADPGGEMIALLLGDGRHLLAAGGHLIGLTGYADFALAQDVLRGIGRPIRHAVAIDENGRRTVISARTGGATATLSALLGPLETPTKRRATSFAWMA